MKNSPTALGKALRFLAVFFRTEAIGGTVLILATIAALALANSPLQERYVSLWANEITIGFSDFALTEPLLLWVNDFLMAIFFLVVTLEIKRELLFGELNTVRKAALPAIAALGGMLVPAAIFLWVSRGTDASRGWGIPMATDIAFALGCLRLLGTRIPLGLVSFLTALAIIDDLGAILVIALFYPSALSFSTLGAAGIVALVLVAMRFCAVRSPWLYVLVGLPLWVCILKSGIHATIAGVILGLCIPGDRRSQDEESPLFRLERRLHPWVAFGIVPLFALANAGVSLAGMSFAALGQPASLSTLLGLFLGKQAGVFGATFLAVKSRLGALPAGVGWRAVYGMSVLAGIGFTMSLFIASLAYGEGGTLHQEAKIGILAGSLISAAVGVAILARRVRVES